MVLQSLKRLFRQGVAATTSLSLAFAPAVANAQQAAPSIVIDNRTNPSAPSPSLDRTANGVQQLNIATPNGAGLSHNMFTQYGVEQKGLILNNATKATQTQLGGYVYGNANLHGKAANVILNEVTGTQASQMLGYTEVAGQKANVVVANPNGITCNGCGFINTDRVSLSTGHPEIDASGKLSALTVSDGLIAFEGKGGDFTAVPVLDILSRRVMLDAKVNARTAHLVAGRSRFDYETGTVHALKSDGSKTPEFAIDSTALGGMYAGQISMIVNEAGAGVRVNGTMAANAGDMTLTADGRLVLNGSMTATGNVSVQAGGVQNAGTLQSGADARLVSTADVSNTGIVSAGQALSISGSSLTNNGTMTASGKDGASFASPDAFSNSGQIGATQGGVSVRAGSVTTASGSRLASVRNIAIQTDGTFSHAGEVSTSGGSLTLSAGNVTVSGGELASMGTLRATASSWTASPGSILKSGDALSLGVSGPVSNDGVISAVAGVFLTSDGNVTNGASGSITAQSGPLVLSASHGAVTNTGQIETTSVGDLTVSAASLDNTGTVYGSGAGTLTLSGALRNVGGQIGTGTGPLVFTAQTIDNTTGKIISAADPATLTADTIANSRGVIQAAGDLLLSAASLDNRAGGTVLSTGGALTLTHGQAPMDSVLNQGGSLGAAGSLSLNTSDYVSDATSSLASSGVLTLVMTGTLENAGQLIGEQGFALTIGALKNEPSGLIAAKSGDGRLTVTGPGGLINAGTIETVATGSQLTVTTSAGGLANSGLLTGVGSVALSVASAVTNSGALSAQGGNLSLKTATLANSGSLAAVSGLTVSATSGVTNDQNGQIAVQSGALSLTAGGSGLSNAGQIGTVDAGNLTISAASLTNTGVIGATGSGTITADGDISNSGSLKAEGQRLTVHAHDLTDSGTLAATAGDLVVQMSGALTNSGTLYGARSNTLTVSSGLDNSGGQIGSGTGALTLSADALANSAGNIISSSGGVRLMVNRSVDNRDGTIQGQGDVMLSAASLDNRSGGTVLSLGGALTLSDGSVPMNSLLNQGGTLGGAGLVTLNTETYGSDATSALISTDVLTLTMTGALENEGRLVGQKGFAVTAGSFQNGSGGILAAVTGDGTLTTTGSGGVTNAGTIETLATGSFLALKNSGGFANSGSVLSGGATVLTALGDVTNSGKLSALGGDLTLSAATLGNSGTLAASRSATVTAGNDLTTTGVVYAGNGLTLTAGKTMSVAGASAQIGAGRGDIALRAADLRVTNGQIIAAAGQLTVAASHILNSGGLLESADDLSITTDGLTNRDSGVLLASGGALNVSGLSTGEAGTVSNTGGTFQGQAGVTVRSASVDNTGGTLLSVAGPLSLVSEGLLNNSSGIIQSATEMSLVVGSYSSDVGAVLSAGGTLSASVSGQMDNAGHIIAAGDIDLTTGSLVTHSAATASDVSVIASTGGNLTVHAGAIVNAGALEATGTGGLVRLVVDQINNTGALSAAGDLMVSGTGALTSSGTMLAQKGNATISANSVTNSGFAGGAASLTVAADGSLMNSGTLYSGGDLTARSGGMLGNGGGQIGGSVIDLTARGVLDNSAGTVVASAGDLALQAGQVMNGTGGVLQSSASVTLTTDTLQNAGGTVLAKAGDLTVLSPEGVAGTVDNGAGTLQAGGAIILPFSTLNNAGGSILALGDSLTLAGTTASVVANANGKIESNGTLSLTAGRYTTQEPVSDATLPASRLAAAGDMILTLSDQVQNSGFIAAGRSLTLTADSAANDAGAVIASTAGNLALNLSGAHGLENAGTIQSTGAGGTLKIGTQSLENTATGGILSNGAQILNVSGTLANAGEITAYGNPLIINSGSVTNSNLLLAGSDLTLSTTGNVTNTGLVYGKMNTVLSADQLDNRGGQIGAGEGGLTVTASSLDNSQNGRIIATDGAATITSGPVANDNGLIESGSDLALYTTDLTNSSGKVLADRGSVILAGSASGESAGPLLNDTGVMQAGESLIVIADTLSNRSGTVLTQNGDLSLSAPNGAALHSVDDTGGRVQSGRDLALNTQVLTGATGLSAGRDMSVTLGSGISDPMLFSAGRDMTLTLNGNYSITAGSGVIAGGDAHISASSVNNAGAMMAGGTLSVRTPGTMSNTGLLDGTGGLSLTLDGALSNVQGAILSDAGNIEIGGLSRPYAGAVLNRSGEIMAGSAAGDVVIRAASLTNDILGGVTTTSNQVVYDKKYTVGADALATPPALNPSLENYGAINRYYNHVMKIYVPELWYSATGQKGTGYYFVALDGASASSFVEVTGTGSSATAANAAALISAGRNLVVETTGDILNDASHIAAGQDMALTGASLTNKGYDTEIVWSLTENSPHLKRWFTPSDGSQFVTPDPAASSNSAGNPGWMTLNGGPHTALWGSSTYTGLSGSIVAGGNLTGSFTGDLNNTTVVAHATPDLLASANGYSGTTPGSVSPAGSVAAASGGGLVVPGSTGSFADASTATSSGTSGAGAVSGGQLDSKTGTTAAGQASAVSGGTLDGISAGSTQAVSTQAGGGATTTVPAGSSVTPPVYGNVLPPEGHESGATTAQNLALPGFSGVAAASVSQVISSVPAGKALYVPSSSPDAHVLIETNPAYTSLTAFHGSEYLLDRLGDQPQDYTFLGDSAFDQQYVQQQIVSATGQTFLGGTFTTASSQMQALLDNAVSESNQLGLSLGQGLSSAQQAALTSDIVWYQNEVVDGKTVLVPKLYLAPGHEALTGASISGKNVSLTAASVRNSGSVSAQDALSITATSGDITNTGSLSGGTVSLTAQDGSILNSDTINTYLVQGGTQGQLASVGTITATGAASLSAAKDITFNGGVLTTGSDLSVLAGDGLTLGTTTVQQAAAVSGKSLSLSGSQTQNYGTTVSAGGNATLAALGGDLKAAGATLTSEGSTALLAGKTLDLGSVTNSQSSAISGSKSGFLTHSSFSNSQSSSTDVGTTVAAGKDLTAVSGGDMHVAGMVGGGGDVTLQSGGALTESALHSTASESSSHHVAGFHMSTQGASGTVGYGSRTDAQSVSSSTYTPSVIASTGGSLSIRAHGPVTIDASVVAAAKDLGISGSSVAFSTEQNSTTQTAMHKDKSIGVTGGVSPDSMVGQAINGALGAKQSGTGVQSALAGIQTDLGEGMSAIGGATTNNIIGGQVSVGFSSNKSRSGETRTTVQGSTASAGGTLAIEARGDNATDKTNGDLSATAAHLSGQDVALAAQKDLTLQSGVNTDHTEATSSSKSASVGVEASIGTTGNVGVSVTASASASQQHSESDSTTNVDTTVSATHAVTLNTPGTTTLNGAEVNGERVSVKSGMLVITSPQDTARYYSTSESGGLSVSIPVYGAGSFGASANGAGQTINDTYRSTEATQSGLYAGNGGLDVDVSGNTTLKAGVISSTAESSLNHFHTQSLDTTGKDNQSTWSGTSVAAGGGFSTAGSLADAAKTVTVAAGHVDHNETTTTQSVITGNIGVDAGSSTGSYSTDLTAANGHLDNSFNATKVNNTLQTEIGAETAAETAVEVGMQAYDRWGAKAQQLGNAGKEQPTASSSQAEKPQSDQPIQTGVQGGNTSPEGPNTQLNAASAHDGSGNTGGAREEAAVRQGGSVTMVGQEPTGTATGQSSSGSVFWQESSHSTVMTPEGQVEYISVTGHHRSSQPAPGAASSEAAITWSAVGKLGLVTGSMIPGPVGAAFSTGLAVEQWQSGDKTGALVTLGLGALNLVGVDAAAGRVILGMKETQTAATVGRGVAKEGGAAATATASDTWQTYEKGYAGAAQPSLPDGYSWVRNSEGDLGIRTSEGKVVTDSQGKRDIISQTSIDTIKVNENDLLALSSSGVKFSPQDIVAIGVMEDGKIAFLEKGNEKAGLQHIINSHVDDFERSGVSLEEIPSVVMRAVTKGKIIGYQGKGNGRPIYEVTINGEKKQIAVTVSSNGFIVGANPRSIVK